MVIGLELVIFGGTIEGQNIVCAFGAHALRRSEILRHLCLSLQSGGGAKAKAPQLRSRRRQLSGRSSDLAFLFSSRGKVLYALHRVQVGK